MVARSAWVWPDDRDEGDFEDWPSLDTSGVAALRAAILVVIISINDIYLLTSIDLPFW